MPESDSKPSKIGGFELLATLGKGGMGVVFKARQVSMDRIVALKVLPPHLAKDEAYVARFLREARSAAKLNHPNIVQGIDVGVAEGNYYFAMEFVDGTTVKELLKAKGRLDEKSALNIVGAVARALEHAHKHGIIHRDIKPDNIMVARDGAVKLADLGLARSTEKPDTMTIEGTALGTPYYMAPEQVRAQTDINTRADIYALGATLYHMVTGEFAYTGPNAGAIMARHLADPVPSARDKHPDVSRATDDLIQRMMAKDPADRPQTPTELLAEVRDALAGKVHLRRVPHRRPHPHPLPAGEGVGHGPLARPSAPLRPASSGPLPPTSSGPLPLGEGRVRGPGRGARPEPKRKATHLAAVAILALLAIAGLILLLRPGRKPPESVPEHPRDLAAKPPEDPKKTVVDDAEAKRRAAELAEQERVAKARQEGKELLEQADAAIAAKDFPKARATIKSAQALGLPDLDDEAKKKLAEIASREKSAAEWAKWDAIKSDAKKLIEAGKLDDAAKLLDGAKALPLDDIADLIGEQMKTIEAAKRKAAEAALAAYQAESGKLWALFKKHDYAAADALLNQLAADPRFGVRPSGAENIRVGDADSVAIHLKADLEAAKLLKEFWAAVEKGVLARKGKFVSIAGKGGNVESVVNGQVTLKVGAREFTAPLLGMDAAQAAAIADLKDDEHGNLVKALFLLVEGEKLDDAEKLLTSAGAPPALPIYKDRLDRLLGRAKVIAEARDAEAREAAARDAWRQIEAAGKGELTQERARRLLPAVEQFAREHAATRFYEGVRAEAKALEARVREAAYTQAKQVDLVAEYAAGRWRDVVARGKWVKEPGGYRMQGVGGGGPDFGWSYSLPTGTSALRLAMKFRMSRGSGATQITFDETPNVPTGTGVLLSYKWAAGFSVGRLDSDGRDMRTVPLPETSDGWHSLVVDVAPASITAALDDKAKVQWDGQTRPRCITLSGDEFLEWRIQSLRLELLVKTGPLAAEPVEHVKAGEWQSLFDGKTLKGWQPVKLPQDTAGKAYVQDSRIVLDMVPGAANALAWADDFPSRSYELEFDAMKLDGEYLCDVIFPVAGSQCILKVWGDGAGLDVVDWKRAWENETKAKVRVEPRRRYECRLRVTDDRVQGWFEKERIIDLPTEGHKFTLNPGWVPVKSIALCTWNTKTSFANIRLRRIEPGAAEAPKAGEWQSLFDGKTLDGWKVAEGGDYVEHGQVKASAGQLVIGGGKLFSGVACTAEFPSEDYEVSYEVKRVNGRDSFGSAVLPVGSQHVVLATGGWGGSSVSLHWVDGKPGEQNATTRQKVFENGRWYRVRARVTEARIQAWIDDEKLIDTPVEGHKFTVDGHHLALRPFGFQTAYNTTGALRNIRLRRIEPGAEAAPEGGKPGGYALQFDGVDDDVEVPYAEAHALKRGAFTVEARFCAEAPAQTPAAIVLKRPPEGGGRGGTFIIRLQGNTPVYFVATSGPDKWNSVQGPAVEMGRWYHTALTYDGERMAAYLDGERVAELLVRAPLLGDGQPTHIGREIWDKATFAGRIRDVRLWQACRSAEEIAQNKDRALKGTELDLVGYWDFSEGKGDLLHDRTRHKAHGKIRGAKWVSPEGKPQKEGAGPAQEEPKPAKWQSLFDGRDPAARYRVRQLLAVGGLEVRLTGDGLRLSRRGGGHHARLWTREEFAAPLRIRAVAMTDSTNLRLYYGGCRLIFNWEMNQAELRYHRMPENQVVAVGGKGKIPANEWAEVVWAFEEDRVTVAVNGEQRASIPGKCTGLRGQVGIGPAEGSVVSLKSLVVEAPAGLATKPEPRAEDLAPGKWQALFDGKSLDGWRTPPTGSGRPRKVYVEKGCMVLDPADDPCSGVSWKGEFPQEDYEVVLEAMRAKGSDCFCQIWFPIGGATVWLALGGWGGETVGLEMVDSRRGSDNVTTRRMKFELGRWYPIILRVTRARVQAWIDREKVVDVARDGHVFQGTEVHPGFAPFGLYAIGTKALVRNVKLRRVGAE